MKIEMALDKERTLDKLARELYEHDLDSFEKSSRKKMGFICVGIACSILGLFVIWRISMLGLFVIWRIDMSMFATAPAVLLLAFFISVYFEQQRENDKMKDMFYHASSDSVMEKLDKMHAMENPPGYPYLYNRLKQLQRLYALENVDVDVKVVPETGDVVLTTHESKEKITLPYEVYEVSRAISLNKIIIKPVMDDFYKRLQ